MHRRKQIVENWLWWSTIELVWSETGDIDEALIEAGEAVQRLYSTR